MKTIQPRAGILYSGPSLIDGAPIVAIGVWPTGAVTNTKTGRMLQTFILRADMSPVDAIGLGADVSICGNCKHRGAGAGFGGRSCYVNVGQAPNSVWRAYRRGSYPALDVERIAALGAFRAVRLGTYGDPLAVPAQIWRDLLRFAEGHTGYTHQWREPRAAAYRGLCVASVDSAAELERARALGWRTFRVRGESEPIAPAEFVCPASAESQSTRAITCGDCLACDGAESGRRGSAVIVAHGAFARRFGANQRRG